MKPENFQERKKSLLKLGILCVTTVVLLGGSILLLNSHDAVSNAVVVEGKHEAQHLVPDKYGNSDSILRIQANRLMTLDERLIRLSDSLTVSAVDLEHAEKEVSREEVIFQNILDSMDGQGDQRRSLSNAFRTMLRSQDALIYHHFGAAAKRPNAAVGTSAASLSSKIDPLLPQQEQATDPGGRLSKDNALLRRQLEELQQNNAAVNLQLSNLQHSNENLLMRLNAARSSTGASQSLVAAGTLPAAEVESQNHAVAVSNSSPERKAPDESEELLFAQADCNMSRADSRQIIYNARQRKDLLIDALTTLNGLARSPHTEIQNKAKAKIAQLRTIASTIHD